MSRLFFPFSTSLCVSACLVLSSATVGLAGTEPAAPAPIMVQCDAEVIPEFCAAVTDALMALDTGRTVHRGPAPEAGGHPLKIQIRQIDHNAVRFSAQLIWQAPGADTRQEGPVFEVASMDAPMSAGALKELAQLLVERSDLPL